MQCNMQWMKTMRCEVNTSWDQQLKVDERLALCSFEAVKEEEEEDIREVLAKSLMFNYSSRPTM